MLIHVFFYIVIFQRDLYYLGMSKSKYRKKVDWVPIEPYWAAGQLSKAEIGRKFEVSVAALNKRFKKTGLVYGSLSSSVKLKIDAKLIEEPDKEQVSVQVSGAKPEDVVDQAAEIGANVIRCHRKDIAALREEEAKLLLELGDDPTKLWIGQHQGQIVKEEVGIAVTERIAALRNLTAARERRIKLERQAFNLDAEQPDTGNSVADAIREAECERR